MVTFKDKNNPAIELKISQEQRMITFQFSVFSFFFFFLSPLNDFLGYSCPLNDTKWCEKQNNQNQRSLRKYNIQTHFQAQIITLHQHTAHQSLRMRNYTSRPLSSHSISPEHESETTRLKTGKKAHDDSFARDLNSHDIDVLCSCCYVIGRSDNCTNERLCRCSY